MPRKAYVQSRREVISPTPQIQVSNSIGRWCEIAFDKAIELIHDRLEFFWFAPQSIDMGVRATIHDQ